MLLFLLSGKAGILNGNILYYIRNKSGVSLQDRTSLVGWNVKMKIGIGNDHSALELKAEIIEFLKEKGHEVVDYGTYTTDSCDYPVYGEKVARAVVAGEVEKGILICGTGLGISLAANKVKGIRACVCSEPFTAKMSRAHNDCNILAFGARVVGGELAKMIVDTWINTEFEGGRHQRRVDLLMEIEERN